MICLKGVPSSFPTQQCQLLDVKVLRSRMYGHHSAKHSSTADLQVSLTKTRSWSQATSSVQKSSKRDSVRMLCKFFVITCNGMNSFFAVNSKALASWTTSFVASPVNVTTFPSFCNVASYPYSKSCKKVSMASRTSTFTMESSNHATSKGTPTCATGINFELCRTTTLKLL